MLLVDRGLAESRERAQAMILAGVVFDRSGRRLDKPGRQVPAAVEIELKVRDHPWVSRGGIKLAFALDRFQIEPGGLTCLDIGASTGGFTDVLLQRGAAKVFAVDVGHGQLAWKIRQDGRVIVRERVNARYLDRSHVPDDVDLIAVDVSFISLTLVLPAVLAFARPGTHLVALIKPQFEAGRGRVGKGGVVGDPAVHRDVVNRISAWLAGRNGWRVSGVVESPVRGAEGNVEFLLAARHS
jgi:23S rRNA (cytidine1920-2'-O)/16S rRNA (cytidine1409-2'-O)-methyltransferase